MNKKIGALTAVILALTMLFSLMTVSVGGSSAALYGVYGDGMLFRQNSEAVLAGTANPSSVITCEIVDPDGTVIAKGESRTASDGVFSVTAQTPEGGYTEYTVTLYENGEPFASLHNVVFGELWLAAGQSNMQLALAGDSAGEQSAANGETFSYWLRFLQMTDDMTGGSSDRVPAEPQTDRQDCRWVNGTEREIYNSSAVAFYFARRLQQTLNMPVGILQATLGGSSISAWLPRTAVDADSSVKNILEKNGTYIEQSDWNEETVNAYAAVSACYNMRIAPLTVFRLSGMLWYQGESEVVAGVSHGDYSKEFSLLQQSYSARFGCDGTLPVVFSQLASYGYGNDFRLQNFNIELSEIQQADPQTRAMAAIYDVPLTYKSNVGAIHPLQKTEVGERLAFCAEGLVYRRHTDYTAPTVASVQIKDDCLLVTLKNVGDGLTADGRTLKGFAVCGEDSIYLEADAEIMSADTVRIRNDNIKNPVSASYAVSQYNGRSNLFAGTDGEKMPVSPFLTDAGFTAHLWKDNGWTDCDDAVIWRSQGNGHTGFADTWTAENADVTVTQNSAYAGDGGLSVVSDGGTFSVSPVLTDRDGRLYYDVDGNWRDYQTLSFKVRNNGSESVTFDSLQISADGTVFMPVVMTEKENRHSQTIPADGDWHTVTLSLESMTAEGEDTPLNNESGKLLSAVDGLQFVFRCESGSADLSVDSFAFSVRKTAEKKKTVFDKIREFFEKILEFFRNLFGVADKG